MSKRVVIITFVVLFVATAAAMAFMFIRETPQWTTSSREAREAFEKGLSDEMKLYRTDALAHYARALELDPSFAMARLKVEQLGGGTRNREKWRSLLESIDTTPLSEREKTLIAIRLARAENRHPDAETLIDTYVEANPRDPHILSLQCDLAWARQRWSEARSCYQRLLDVDPNWVVAVNHLGYISMAEGSFDEAADHFRTYRYIAPDQANPYDSMGELLMLRGRYDEARTHFTRALDIRPDFCASWNHLVQLDLVQGQLDRARHTADRASAEAACANGIPRMNCQIAIEEARRDPASVPETFREQCLPDQYSPDAIIVAHRTAANSGDEVFAKELTGEIDRIMATAGDGGPPKTIRRHMQGMEDLANGNPSDAAAAFAASDGEIVWFGDSQGIFKIYNRAALTVALQRAGRTAEASTIRDESRLVNAALFDEFARELAQVR